MSSEEPGISATPFPRTEHAGVRDTLIDLHTDILKLHNRDDIQTCGRHLGLLKKKTLVFDNEAEMSILSDYEIYSYRPRGFNAAELYLRLNHGRLDRFKRELLTRMSAAQYSLLKIDSVESDGIVHVTDLLSGLRLVLMDNGLSQSGRPGQGFAAHLLAFDDYSSQTGGILPVDAGLLNDPPVVRVMTPMIKGDVPITDSLARAKLARAVISAAIRLGYTGRVAYQ
jgi:hypothetical protein